MEKVTLQDLPEKDIVIKFNDRYAREFFTKASSISKIDDIFLFLGLKSTKQLIRRYRCNKSSYSLVLVNRIFKEMSKIDKGTRLSDMERNIISIGSYANRKNGGKPGKMMYNPHIPFALSSSISRLIAHTLGDGNVNDYGGIRYTNTNKKLIDEFVNDLESFGKIDYRITFDSNAHRVHVPKIVKLILDKFGLEDENYDFILNTSKENQTAFVQALFDDEGNVNVSGLRLNITSSNKKLLEAVQVILRNLTIISRIRQKGTYVSRNDVIKKVWSIEISGLKNFRIFYLTIKLQHPNKRNELDKLMRFYKGKRERRLRNELKLQVLDLLKKKSLTVYEIAEELKIPIISAQSHFLKLSQAGLLFAVGRKRKGNQNAIIWSASRGEKNYASQLKHDRFSKIILKEMNSPKTTSQLSNKFSRTPVDIFYHLRKLRDEDLVKMHKIRKGVLWYKKNVKLNQRDELCENQKKIIYLLNDSPSTVKNLIKISKIKESTLRHDLYVLRKLDLVAHSNGRPKIWSAKKI